MLWLAYVLIFLYGLAHTPLLVDVLRQLFPHWNVKRVTSHAASFILILLILFVFFLSLSVHVFVFLPLVSASTPQLILHCIFAYWVWVNAFVNYVYTVFSKPGIFTFLSDSSGLEHAAFADESCGIKEEELSGLDTRECDCKGYSKKEPNSYACRTCGCVIPYRDHHCPFTGNCIGLHNYSYFLLSLFYSMVGLGYEVSVFFAYFGECSFLIWRAVYPTQSNQVKGICRDLEPYGESVLPAIGALVTVSVMFFLQVFMLAADISTYQLLKQWRRVKIDLRKPLQRNSRFRVMFLNQRSQIILFLLPIRNKTDLRPQQEDLKN